MSATLRPITVVSFSTGAAASHGSVVVIDVIRAFMTAATALARGAETIVMVDDLERALRLRAEGIGRYCMGERGGEKPEGFDFGNAPGDLAAADLAGTTIIQTTSNGTRGIAAAAGAGAAPIYAGAFATAEATAKALLAEPSDAPITLAAMGYLDRLRTEEDEVCALYLRSPHH